MQVRLILIFLWLGGKVFEVILVCWEREDKNNGTLTQRGSSRNYCTLFYVQQTISFIQYFYFIDLWDRTKKHCSLHLRRAWAQYIFKNLVNQSAVRLCRIFVTVTHIEVEACLWDVENRRKNSLINVSVTVIRWGLYPIGHLEILHRQKYWSKIEACLKSVYTPKYCS